MDTWIKLYRQFAKWEWFNISEMVHLFIYLLISANNKEGEWRGVNVKRGQLITGLNSLHKATGISFQTLRTCLKRLEKTKEINMQSTNKYSIITICNYDEYQMKQQSTNKLPNKQLTSNQQTTNNKQEYKEGKEVKKYIDDSELNLLFIDFLNMRREIKKPATNKAIELLIAKLKKLSSDKETQKAIIEQSIIKNYQGLFAVSEYKKSHNEFTEADFTN